MKLLNIPALSGIVLLMAVGVASCGGDSATEELPAAAPDLATAVADEPTATPEVKRSAPQTVSSGDEKLVPELVGISSWINSEPLTLEELRGKVVLIDFWTYTCINCIRTFPFLKEWHAKYADKGLVIIGVHTPEFEFEKIRENVIDAAVVQGLEYPIAQDNDFQTWGAFRNNAWPAKYLIDKDGHIRYAHIGEGAYTETEQQIRDLLSDTGVSVADVDLNVDTGRAIADRAYTSFDPGMRITRELYAGVQRNYALTTRRANVPYVYPAHEEYFGGQDVDVSYEDPGDHVNHFMYLQGLWRNGLESLTHARETQSYEDYIAIKFTATSVNVVLGFESAEPYDVRVTIDGRPLEPSEAGADIMFDEEGNSFLLVDEARMYRAVKVSEYEGHELSLSSNSADFSVFAYTFGAFIE